MLKKLSFPALFFMFLQHFCLAQNAASYQNYDFIAGDKIIFSDDFAKDKDGEFPSHWKLEGGQGVINIQNNEKFFSVLKYYTIISPRMKSPTYLPSNYTIEFDYYLDAKYDGNPGVILSFRNGDEVAILTPGSIQIDFSYPGGNLSGDNPSDIKGESFYDKWHHIALAFKNNQLKVYINQHRVLTVPECNFKATSLAIKGNASEGMNMFFKNFRLAEGGDMNLIDKALTEGKFVTSAITFEVNKAGLKNESMGILNEVTKFMKANPTVKFEVDGYTDSDGDDAANLTLSQKRANAVKDQLVSMGIETTRLSAKGFGETKPVGDNTTSEGRAQNRRVEFLKMP